MEIYKLRRFAKWAERIGISDNDLVEVAEEMNRGLLGDRLGAHIYKKRLALRGRGKSSGARSIIAYKKEEIVYFIFGYTKNDKANLSHDEEDALRLYAKELIELTSIERSMMIHDGKLIQVDNL